MIMDFLKRAPTTVVITTIATCGVLALGVLAAFVVLSINGADTTELRQWVNTIGQLLVYPFLGTATVASIAAARSSRTTEVQTNGQHEALEHRLRRAEEELNWRRRGDAPPPQQQSRR